MKGEGGGRDTATESRTWAHPSLRGPWQRRPGIPRELTRAACQVSVVCVQFCGTSLYSFLKHPKEPTHVPSFRPPKAKDNCSPMFALISPAGKPSHTVLRWVGGATLASPSRSLLSPSHPQAKQTLLPAAARRGRGGAQRGHPRGYARVTNGEECFSSEPFSKSSSIIHGH